MDNFASNKSQAPCRSWGAQNVWSATSTAGSLLNPQRLGLGSSPDPTPSYDQLHESNQSCVSDARHALCKASLVSSFPPCNALFADTAPPRLMMSFPSRAPSMLLSATGGKYTPPPSLLHTSQAPQPCGPPLLPMPPPHNPYKAPFQRTLSSHSLPNRPLPGGVPPCGRHVSTSRAAFDGVEFSAVAGSTHSRAPSTPQEQSHWRPSSHCSGAGEKSIPVTAPHPENQLSHEGKISEAPNHERQRQVLLHQRAQLLQRVAELDKLVEERREGESPHEAPQSPPAMDDSSQCEQSRTSDALQLPLSATSESQLSSGCSSAASCDEQSKASDTPDDQMSAVECEKDASESADDGDLSDFLSDCDWASSDESSPGSASAPPGEEPPPPDEEGGESASSLVQEESVSPPQKIRPTNPRNSFETVVLPSSNSKTVRVYDRRNYCLFCNNPLSKMSRHFERIHSDKPEVAAAFQYPKKSRERYKIWNRLINQGNFAHNKEVLKTGRGQLVSRKRPSTTQRAQDFLHCLYCRGLFIKKALHRHMKSCPEKAPNDAAADEPELGRRRLALRCVLETLEDLGISDGFKDIMSPMVFDDVTQAIMADEIILQYGEELFSQQGSDPKKHHYIRQNLRQIARLVQEARETTPLQKLEDFFLPSAFPHVVSAVNALAGYNAEMKTYGLPSLAIKLGYNLQKTCAIVEGNAVRRGDARSAEAARSFLAVYRDEWNPLVSGAALASLRETKLAKERKVPFGQDVRRLNSHMEEVHLVAERNLRDAATAENYASLATVTLARTLLFNRRSVMEVSSVELSAFKCRKKSTVADGVVFSDLERNMCEFFTRISVRGNTGKMVPVFLKPSFVSAMELLVSVRKKCGVLRQNPYVFGRPQTLSAYSAAECIQKFVKKCGAEDPKVLTTAKIRRHYGAMLQLINLDEGEASQILGPNNQVQRLREDGGLRPHARMDSDASDLWQQKSHEAPTEANTTPLLKSDKEGSKYRGKHKWEEEEVLAVERHMMRFIEAHKVPQKIDCSQCLEAEPKALKMRSWKGVKDYVRNRITALKRQSRTPEAPS
ncbi:uncharacterized protein AB9W97_013253 isoform 2-T3 [Spinachia spinachia]